MTLSERAKGLIRRLSRAQAKDLPLVPYITPHIRYNLLYKEKLCVQIRVQLDESTDTNPSNLSFHDLPGFLIAQLEAQKITDSNSLWYQVAPLLEFIQGCLRESKRSRAYPTLFSWYCRKKHRTFFFFAFVKIKMAPRTYTANELLSFQDVPAERPLYEKMYKRVRKDAELNDIVRLAPEFSLPLIVEEERSMTGSHDGPALSRCSGVSQLDGTDAEWAYRGRTASEHAESQPIPAPTGLLAQQDEGFQRFYKAVISPSHVRVTAGGRIVPNTRGTSSPTSKWAKNRGTGNSQCQTTEAAPFPTVPAQYGGFAPVVPGYPPPMAPGMMPGTHMPFMPMPMGFNMPGGFPMPAPHLHRFPSAQQLTTPSTQSSRAERQSDTSASEKGKPVRISPPEQFDQTRPFMYNGQWMMPQGGQFYPYGMLPPPAFQATPMHGPMLASPGAAIMPMGHPYAPRIVQGPPRPHFSNGSSMSAMSVSSLASGLPLSSIRPSEITKKQIESLRGSLRYLEDQLQYNKHQIDEKGIEHQAQQLRLQIQHFEKNLEVQISFEENHYPQSEKKEETRSSSRDGLDEQDGEEVTPRPAKNKSTRAKGTTKFETGINSSKSAVSGFTIDKSLYQMTGMDSRPLRTSTSLPSTAALAPPFQPRESTSSQAEAATPSYDFVAPEVSLVPPVQPVYPSIVKGGSEWKSFFKNTKSSNHYGNPYLVGELPDGIVPDEARDTDYSYDRELTEDELRARHMYWGKAPHHLQKGLPKYDGRNFYPPSPLKNRPKDKSSGSSIRGRQVPDDDMDYAVSSAKTDSNTFQTLLQSGRTIVRNPFGNVTQSEALPRLDQAQTIPVTGPSETGSIVSQVSPRYRHFRKAVDKSARGLTDSPLDKSSSDSGDDDRSLIFQGRRAMGRPGNKTYNDIWHTMLKKGKTSSNVIPSKVSSTTVQGLLPNYAGHATASLAPTIVNTTVSPRGRATKVGDVHELHSASPVIGKRRENRPPGDIRRDDSSNRGMVPR